MKRYSINLMIALFSVMTIFGCSKNIAIDDNEPEYGIGITVSVGGIKEDFELSASTQNTSLMYYEDHPDISKIISFNDFDAISSVVDERPNIASNILKREKNKIVAQNLVAQGVKYYLLLFEDNAGVRGNFHSSTLLTSGEPKTIIVQAGKKYHWIAYSYNSDESDLPAVSPPNFTVSMGENKDFLYASGISPTVSSTATTFLTIIFNHMLTRVGIEINTRGMFADSLEYAEVQVNDNLIRKASIDLLASPETAISVTTGSASSNFYNNVIINKFQKSSSNRRDVKVGYVYLPSTSTTSTQTLNNFKVRLNQLRIRLDAEARALGQNSRTFGPYTGNAKPEYTTNITGLGRGKSKVFKIDMVESPLEVTTQVRINYTLLGIGGSKDETITAKWARSNIYYHSDGSYRFQHINILSNKRTSYFSWGSVNPYSYGSQEDPCKLVYPYNLWKTASNTEYRMLLGGTVNDALLGLLTVDIPILSNLLAGLGVVNSAVFPGVSQTRTLRYIQFAHSSTSNPYYVVTSHPNIDDVDINNKLRFNFNGYYANIGLIENLLLLSLGSTYEQNVRLWTSTAGASLPLLGTAVGAMQFQGNSTNADLIAALLNINALGIGVAKTDLQNIRCVRAQ